MIRKFALFSLCLMVAGCGAVKKKTTYSKKRQISVEASEEDFPDTSEQPEEEIKVENLKVLDKADEIIGTALTYSGVKYRFGGTTNKGMDCSGLLYVSFKAHEVALPRVSHEMANEGKRIRINQVTKGDLLFFKTSKRGKRINHVGLVVSVDGDDIKFIHSTSSRGVIVSSLREGFWNYAFVKATRVL